MDNSNTVEPLQNPGEASQPSVLDRLLHRPGGAEVQPEPVTDNVTSTELFKCGNPGCAVFGTALVDGICATCGYNQKERF